MSIKYCTVHNRQKIIERITLTCREYIQWDAMQDPKHYYHGHWEFQPEVCHDCRCEKFIVIRDEKSEIDSNLASNNKSTTSKY